MNFEMGAAARTIWGEARGEPMAGQKAVAHVLVNRVKDGRWGKSLASVCLWQYQFSCWLSRDPNFQQMCLLAEDDLQLATMASFVVQAYNEPDPTNGSTHYYSKYLKPAPSWADSATFEVEIGAHRFYSHVK